MYVGNGIARSVQCRCYSLADTGIVVRLLARKGIHFSPQNVRSALSALLLNDYKGLVPEIKAAGT